MSKLFYMTGNYGKYIRVKEKFDTVDVDIDYSNCDLDELDVNDIELISKNKAIQAYDKLHSPVFVIDSGFYIDEYPNNPGYPGAFVKRSGISSDIDSLLSVMSGVSNRKCRFMDCLTFYDGNEFYCFYGVSEGVLSYEKRGDFIKKALSNLWYVFIPNNHYKTLAEMSDYERNTRNDGHTSALDEFIKWYVEVYLKANRLNLSL